MQSIALAELLKSEHSLDGHISTDKSSSSSIVSSLLCECLAKGISEVEGRCIMNKNFHLYTKNLC